MSILAMWIVLEQLVPSLIAAFALGVVTGQGGETVT